MFLKEFFEKVNFEKNRQTTKQIANSLDPDQDPRNVGPDLGPNLFDTLIMLLKEFFEKIDFEKKTADDNKSMKNYPACKELMIQCHNNR